MRLVDGDLMLIYALLVAISVGGASVLVGLWALRLWRRWRGL